MKRARYSLIVLIASMTTIAVLGAEQSISVVAPAEDGTNIIRKIVENPFKTLTSGQIISVTTRVDVVVAKTITADTNEISQLCQVLSATEFEASWITMLGGALAIQDYITTNGTSYRISINTEKGEILLHDKNGNKYVGNNRAYVVLIMKIFGVRDWDEWKRIKNRTTSVSPSQ